MHRHSAPNSTLSPTWTDTGMRSPLLVNLPEPMATTYLVVVFLCGIGNSIPAAVVSSASTALPCDLPVAWIQRCSLLFLDTPAVYLRTLLPTLVDDTGSMTVY